MSLVIHLLVSGLAVFVAAYVLPGVDVDSFLTALIVAVVLGAVNMFIKPILHLIAFPITILTLGLFSLVINAVLIWMVSVFVEGFYIENFLWAVVFGVLLGFISSFLHSLTK